MNALLLILALTSDPAGDLFILQHLALESESIVVVVPSDSVAKRRLESEWQEERAHRFVLLRMIRRSHGYAAWMDGCDTAVFFWQMKWEDWDQNPYCNKFLEVVE